MCRGCGFIKENLGKVSECSILLEMEERKIKEFFGGKKITLMGLGLLGRGVGDAEFLAKSGADLLVTDLKTESELQDSLKRLKKYENIEFRLGRHELRDFKDRDMIIKSAGIPLNSPFINEAKANGTPVEMSTALFAALSEVKAIGITGTRGKSTTAHLLYEILKKAGKDAVLGGNIKGVSTLSMLPDVDESTIAILELDSWQLQGFGERGISPSISIFTNFYPDHLNYYGGDMNLYFADKANIFRFQKEENVLVVSNQALEEIKKREYEIKIKVLEVRSPCIGEELELKIKGKHNRLNAALAVCVAREIGVGEDNIVETLRGFKGVPGRMEKVGEIKGCEIYNDTTSTTPEALCAALETLEEGKKAVLIAGGSDKGLDMKKAADAINKKASFVCFLDGSGASRFLEEFDIEAPHEVFDTLQKALNKALIIGSDCEPIYAERSRSIILSPGFASFGMFKNEFDRGEQFVKLVRKLKNKN